MFGFDCNDGVLPYLCCPLHAKVTCVLLSSANITRVCIKIFITVRMYESDFVSVVVSGETINFCMIE